MEAHFSPLRGPAGGGITNEEGIRFRTTEFRRVSESTLLGVCTPAAMLEGNERFKRYASQTTKGELGAAIPPASGSKTAQIHTCPILLLPQQGNFWFAVPCRGTSWDTNCG